MNKYMKEKCDVQHDLMKWFWLKPSAIYKSEIKKNKAEFEIIDSYAICMNKICEEIKKEFVMGMYAIKTYSLCIPYVYICRHLIELMLKKAIELKVGGTKTGHSINNLWEDCKKLYDKQKLEYYDELIETFEVLDDNGEKLRYVKDKQGNEFENKPIFLNVELIKEDINKLKEELFQDEI